LHLESRSWRVLWRLFIPGQVSIDYFSGKRKRYPPPVQFFFVIMFFFLLVVNHMVGDSGNIGFRQSDDKIHVASNDTVIPPQDLYRLGQRYAQTERIRRMVDSLPAAYQTPEVRAATDSIIQRLDNGAGRDISIILSQGKKTSSLQPPDSMTFSLGFRQLRIGLIDIFEKDAETLISQYHLTRWMDKVLMRQSIKSVKEPKTLVKTYLGTLAWTLLLLVALMAGVLSLLYIRRNRYYVEHFIFLLHHHTGGYLLLTVILSIQMFRPLPLTVWAPVILWILLSTLFAMRRYYGQGWGKTILKWSIFYLVYFVGFVFLFFIGILFSFILF
jgi:hypothetical protein